MAAKAAFEKFKKTRHLSTEHVFDFPSLILEHQPASCKVVPLVDLDVQVFGLQEIAGGSLPICVMMLTHGRCNSAKVMQHMASGLLGEFNKLAASSSRRKTHDVIVVTFDHRNHGERLKYRNTNLSYDKNPWHLVDMIATVRGGVQDQQLIMDFLPMYLFPKSERVVDQFIPVGVSMGGHTAWRLLREDPRVRIGVPMITIPSEALGENLLERAEQYGLTGKFHYPPAAAAWLDEPVAQDAYVGRQIFSVGGALDFLMPVDKVRPLMQRLSAHAPPGTVEIWEDPGSGHRVSPEMVQRVAEWLWVRALSV